MFFVGPDRTGKTNIARATAAALSVPYFKASSERDTFRSDRSRFINQLRYADMRVADFITQTGVSVIFDRGYPCEFVYSAMTGRETDHEILRAEDDSYAAIGAVIVLCRRETYAGLADDIDESIDSEKLAELDALYAAFARDFTKCSTLTLYVDDEDLERQVSDVKEFIALAKRARSMDERSDRIQVTSSPKRSSS